MPQLQSSTLEAFKSLDESGQRAALGRMSDEAKRTLLGQIRGVGTTQPVAPAPEPPPSRGFPMSLGEAAKRYAQGGIPNVLYGAATAEPSVMSDLMLERIKGIPEAITGIPDMIRSLAPVGHAILAGMGRVQPVQDDLTAAADFAKSIATGAVAPGKSTAQGAAALLAPETFDAPSHEEFKAEARAQGALGGGVLLGRVGAPLVRKVNKYVREAPVRKGYTTLDPATLKPVPPEPPILVEHGLPAPEIPKGRIPEYRLPTKEIAEGLGLLDDAEGTVIKNAIAEIYPDLKYAQAHAEGVRGPVNTPAKARAVVDWNGERYWNIMEPEIIQSGPMQNLATLSADVQAQLPEHVKAFYGEMVKNKLDPIQKIIDQYKKPGEAIPQVDPMLMHGLRKAIRNELDLATTPMEQAIQRQMPKGEILFELDKVLRDKLYDHVQMTRGTDIRPIARKYAMNAMVRGEAADLTTPKGFFETLFSSYTFPTPRAIAARVGETAGKQMMNRLKDLNRGFSHKMTPAEEALVTRPSPLKPTYRSSIAGQTNPPRRGPSIEHGPEPGMIAPEPPPGPTAIIRNWAGPTPKGENVWPAPTKPGVQPPFAERALPESTGKPGKPGEFFPGKQGVRREVVGVDPKTGKPIREVRDYRNQQQLFSIYQTPPPRWKPTERLTSTLKDLTDMRNEIVSYLAKSDVKGTARQEYIADVKAIQAEITRRQQARKAGQQQQ
jgi:hypothetical protein